VVHKRPVALAKLSVPTHHLSLFRVPWRLNFYNVLVLKIAEKLIAEMGNGIYLKIAGYVDLDMVHIFAI
jgi:hypothetical protein